MSHFNQTDMEAAMVEFQASALLPENFGQNDCCIAVADALAKVWHRDLLKEFRGHYATKIGFLRLMTKMGWTSLFDGIKAMAVEAGAIEIMSDIAPQNFDLGFVLIGNSQDRDRVDCSPAIFWNGLWQCHTPNGPTAMCESGKIWRFEKGVI